MSPRYEPSAIEPRWQARWEEAGAFSPRDDDPRPKRYVLEMFPYPSGAGLHLGHVSNYSISDAIARYAAMRGFKVLHPMGWDAFGLPAEQYAIEKKVHPSAAVAANVATYKRQLKMMGFSYDWTREIATTDPAYYRWTQWIFLKLFERGLAYEAEVPVNWCEALGTVLANEEVIDGKSERGGFPVVRKPMRQWVLKITAYADRLLEDLEALDWPEHVKQMQREWIGRSEGAEIVFAISMDGSEIEEFRVFTTRPDTLFGVTFCVLAPEHPAVEKILARRPSPEVSRYVEAAVRRSDRDRQAESKEKTGVFTGAYAAHPLVDGLRVPVWVADYVLPSYGTGAVMGVPGHDARDWAFATTHALRIQEVIARPAGPGGGDVSSGAYEGAGPLVNSHEFTGLSSADAKKAIVSALEKRRRGSAVVRYRLRDWLFSRQRFWGEPFPILHRKDGKVVAVPEADLPVRLPDVARYEPTGTGESPLAGIKDWVETVDPRDGCPARRETNTMPNWAGSCWYYLRYLDPRNDRALVDPAKERAWMPVDTYIGGVEHAVLHLLYARFWHKVLFDVGVVSTKEPFQRLFSQGMVNAATFCDAGGRYLPREAVESVDGAWRVQATGAPVTMSVQRMSKSKKSGVSPDEVVATHGADALRLCVLFMGPPAADKEWTDASVLEGPWRFLLRAWRLIVGDDDTGPAPRTDLPATGALRRALHVAIDGVTRDMDAIAYNTAISKLMVLLNEMQDAKPLPSEAVVAFVKMLSPMAPHVAEEMWERIGGKRFACQAPWPKADPTALVATEMTLPVQVNGKVRDTVTVPADASDADVLAAARASPHVRRHTDGKTLVKEIVVPKRLVNFVVK